MVIVGAILVLILGGLLAVRFLLGGDEDTWICAGGQWVKHGNPNTSQPQTPCDKQ